MNRVFIWMASMALMWGNESFISMEEYGEELYKNPRSIGCIACHGENGEGRVIAAYKERGKLKVLRSPDIARLDFEVFSKKILQDRGAMPKYHLTDEEIRAIYLYLKTRANPPSLKPDIQDRGQIKARNGEKMP